MYTPINHWSEDDRPREKLQLKGRVALSDAELLAIIIGSGSRNESAVQLCQRLLRANDDSLIQLGKMDIKTLMSFKGIGEAKAVSIIAATELGRRRQAETAPKTIRISFPVDTFQVMQPILGDLHHEEFWIICLNSKNNIITKLLVSTGGLAATLVDTRIVFRLALEHRATSIILAHNHPSGNLTPSDSDIRLTQELVSAGKIMKIPILDHLIITQAGYYSFVEGEKM